jgi:hypothetical protein
VPVRPARIALFVLDAFVALTAIGGGAAIVTGADRFPPEWLRGSPFDDYAVPGLILATVVGASAAVAAATTWRRPRLAAQASFVAGAILAGWVIGEVVLLNQNGAATSPRSPVEAIYFAVGVIMILSGSAAWLTRTRRPAA